MPAIFSRVKVLILGLLLSSIFVASLGQSAPSKTFSDGRTYPGCDGAICVLPDCRCPSTEIPGNLAIEDTPQFVTLTIDDAVAAWSLPYIAQVLNGYRNPNNCPAPATFYVSGKYTDYWTVQTLYAQGHEIAVHTLTHNTHTDTSLQVFEDEILGLRRAFSLYSRIPEDKIRGFRAPYLELNNDALSVLYNNTFTYDSSIQEEPNAGFSTATSNMVWPYTMDYGVGTATWIGDLTDSFFPGFWQVPMYTINDATTGAELGQDPKSSAGEVLNMLKTNFDNHRSGNKSPFGLYIHPSYVQTESIMTQVKAFFDYVSSFDDVYFATSSQILDWVRNPIPLSDMSTSPMFACAPYSTESSEICNGLDDDGDGTIDNGLTQSCIYDDGPEWLSFVTCASTCPAGYPTVGTVDYQSPAPAVCGGMVCIAEGTETSESVSSEQSTSSDQSASSDQSVSSEQPVGSSSSSSEVSSLSDSEASSSNTTSLSSSEVQDFSSSHSTTPSEESESLAGSGVGLEFCLGLIFVMIALVL